LTAVVIGLTVTPPSLLLLLFCSNLHSDLCLCSSKHYFSSRSCVLQKSLLLRSDSYLQFAGRFPPVILFTGYVLKPSLGTSSESFFISFYLDFVTFLTYPPPSIFFDKDQYPCDFSFVEGYGSSVQSTRSTSLMTPTRIPDQISCLVDESLEDHFSYSADGQLFFLSSCRIFSRIGCIPRFSFE